MVFLAPVALDDLTIVVPFDAFDSIVLLLPCRVCARVGGRDGALRVVPFPGATFSCATVFREALAPLLVLSGLFIFNGEGRHDMNCSCCTFEGDFRGDCGKVREFEDLGERTRDSEISDAATCDTAREPARLGLERFLGLASGGWVSSAKGAFSLSEEWISSLNFKSERIQQYLGGKFIPLPLYRSQYNWRFFSRGCRCRSRLRRNSSLGRFRRRLLRHSSRTLRLL